jgi:hypothetical protein
LGPPNLRRPRILYTLVFRQNTLLLPFLCFDESSLNLERDRAGDAVEVALASGGDLAATVSVKRNKIKSR